jgi:hypothetical protein
MQCACAMLLAIACRALQYFSSLFHKQHDFRKEVIDRKTFVLICLQFMSEIFFILRRTERDVIKNVYCSSCEVPLFWSDINETWFSKNTQI